MGFSSQRRNTRANCSATEKTHELRTGLLGAGFSTAARISVAEGLLARHTQSMGWEWPFKQMHAIELNRAELMALGATSRGLTAAVRGGFLIRARRDHYVLPGTSRSVVEALRVGGRVACISRLSMAGIFTMDDRFTHIQMEESMSRSRSPRSRHIALTRYNRDGIVLHWWSTTQETTRSAVSIRDALIHATRCQPPWHALASIENALFLKLITDEDTRAIFRVAPKRVAHLEALVDERSESGQETILRMLILSLGLECEVQVELPGLGRVDFVVEGCLVLEADSRLAHDGWEHHVVDRGRDLVAATLGFMALRPAYQHTMFEPDLVKLAIANLVAEHKQFHR